ncbi:unnamed protein product [Moneuplotes crassus]|uniref:Uncharacterized protein n=1 Tax=Euplotes crassus TaxID=5936 RepID=A0AAD1XQC4_EUPCR|nr:unnamed protein product [Moneuplotes crassus]
MECRSCRTFWKRGMIWKMEQNCFEIDFFCILIFFECIELKLGQKENYDTNIPKIQLNISIIVREIANSNCKIKISLCLKMRARPQWKINNQPAKVQNLVMVFNFLSSPGLTKIEMLKKSIFKFSHFSVHRTTGEEEEKQIIIIQG